MRQIIAQIYWNHMPNTYLIGTKFTKHKDRSVDFQNPLIPFGRSLMKWESNVSYQAVKVTPDLPLLLNGKSYHISLKLKSFPEDSLLFRLTFFDLQGQEIKILNFSKREADFTFPVEAATYTFDIINAGCQKLHFQRLQIGPSNLDEKAFGDVYLASYNKRTENKESDLLLVADSQRSRILRDDLAQQFSFLSSLAVMNVSWQKGAQITAELDNWLNKNKQHRIRIFSTDSKFGGKFLKWGKAYPHVAFISSGRLGLKKQDRMSSQYVKQDCQSPDWWQIKNKISVYLRGNSNADR